MSTAPPLDSSFRSFTPPAVGPGDDVAIDPALVQQTKNQIRNLVNEVAHLAQSDLSLDEFYEGFLTRVVAALASFGGAVWTLDSDGELQLQYQINLPKTRLGESQQHETRHRRLLDKMLAARQPLLVPPQSGTPGDDDAGNPTDFLLLLGSFQLEQQVQGVVEIFQRPGAGPTTQRGYLRFLVQMCELVGDFLKNRRLRHFNDRQALWEQLDQFVRAVHRSLDAKQTAFTIANDGRRLMQCDRVSVALCRGSRCEVEVVSGLDTIDRRAEQVARLGQLCTTVLAAHEPLWYSRETRDLSPQIENKLHAYLDQSHAKMVAVLPLFPPPAEDGSRSQPTKSRPIGAVVIEQLADDRVTDATRHRAEAVVQHSSAALANALAHQSLFLLPVWETLGKTRWVVQARNLPKTIFALAAATAAVLALALIPADVDLAARGKLQPSDRREVFALADGKVIAVPVQHGQMVEPGQLLVRMRSDELESEIISLIERQTTTDQQIASVQHRLLDNKGLAPAEENRLAGELAQHQQIATSIKNQLELYQQKKRQLELRSDRAGQVMTWQVDELLLQRPVQKGQVLMSLANPAGEWELELYMPERRMGHVAAAAFGSDEELGRVRDGETGRGGKSRTPPACG